MTVPTGRVGKNKYARIATEKKSMQLRALRLAALSEIPINRNQGWAPWLKPRDGNGTDIAPYINRIRRWIVNGGNSCVRESSRCNNVSE